MDESIIGSIKEYLGIQTEDTAFDHDIVLHVNTTFSTLYQIGVGKEKPFRVESDSINNTTWNDLFFDYDGVLDFIKEYTFLKVRLLFDPPSNSSIMDSLKQVMNECEYRILIQLENIFESEEVNDGE